LAVYEQRRLRGAGGEGAAGRDGHLVLRAVDHGVELGDGRGELELQTDVVEHGWGEHGGFPQLGGVGAAAEDAGHGGQAVAADDAVGGGVVEAVEVAAEEEIVAVVDLVVDAEQAEPPAIVADVDAGRHRRGDGRALFLAAVFARREEVRPAGERAPGGCWRRARGGGGQVVAGGGGGRGEAGKAGGPPPPAATFQAHRR